MLTAPARVVPMYGYGMPRRESVSPSVFFGFSFSIGFAFDCSPLPTPTRMVFPSGMTLTAVGYHPVGMNPFTALLPGASMSMTATQLLPALATEGVLPSGAPARASGALASG